MNTQLFGQNEPNIELRSEYLSVACTWLYVLVMLRTRFRVKLHSIIDWMSMDYFIEEDTKSEV